MDSFYTVMIVHTIVGILASLVRNPRSGSAQKLRQVITLLAQSCQEFLAATDPGVAVEVRKP